MRCRHEARGHPAPSMVEGAARGCAATQRGSPSIRSSQTSEPSTDARSRGGASHPLPPARLSESTQGSQVRQVKVPWADERVVKAWTPWGSPHHPTLLPPTLSSNCFVTLFWAYINF